MWCCWRNPAALFLSKNRNFKMIFLKIRWISEYGVTEVVRRKYRIIKIRRIVNAPTASAVI